MLQRSALTRAVLDLMNQSNRNWGALRMAVRISSYTFSLSKPNLCSMHICERSRERDILLNYVITAVANTEA